MIGRGVHICICRCEYGVLKKCYGEGDMELYSGKLELIVEGWQSAPLLSLREAARLLNPHNAFHGSTCNCKSGCTGRKCTCRQKSAPCLFRPSLINRTINVLLTFL